MSYPYSIVKIDKSSVWDCDENSKELISLKCTIAMIKDLDMKVLAEGVESKENVEFLTEISSGFFQGYFYSRPLPVPQLMNVIRENKIKGEE